MGIYNLSYKNLRRNWLRNTLTSLRIAFGVVVFLILVSSGIGISTVLGQNQGLSGNISAQTNNKSMVVNNIINTLNEYVNSILGTELSNSQLLTGIKGILRNIVSVLDILASIGFLVGIFGINYAMNLNLLERKREIGLFKALGFTELQIMLSFIFEAGLLGFIGAVIGAVLAILGITVLSSFIKIQLFSIVMPVWLPFTAIFITTILSALIATYSIYYYVKEDAVEALRL
ncbi:MAG: ABC transporter permease [Methanobacterium sp.]